MAALRSVAAAALVVFATPARADSVEQWRPLIAEASTRFGIPAAWIERVMRAESGGRTMLGGRPIRSRAGAIGLMQLMPATWAEMRARLGLGNNPDDPRDNILAGSFYLRLMYDRFSYPRLFAAYNAGPGAYAAYLAGRRALPRETLVYLGVVTGDAVLRPSPNRQASPRPGLFVVGREGAVSPFPEREDTAPSMLFAVRRRVP
ncbi:Transglycosylase SLT domain-containing protein [Sphingomonas sp. NFR04]|uniref:lytic transglycosylase domain-containing protein n=1 Tax=Sphingomonas sp. NFR04 TaxID=1566283 RepID=UPI0008E3E6C8|nr:lytic transglycosylase domain-containing protein [Sphingomonas sp. NFR04]SFJ97283.1 Transglycosylase SLT domain-containing protein [Sphingomonas sp. NFR04]